MIWHFMTSREENPYREVSLTTRFGTFPILGIGQLISSRPPLSSTRNTTLSPVDAATTTTTITNNTALVNTPANDIIVTDIRSIGDLPVYNPADMFYTLINALIEAADKLASRPIPRLRLYNPRVDATLLVAPTSMEADPLTYGAVIVVISDLANKIAYMETRYRWRQFSFLVRDQGRIIGRGAWCKGEVGACGERGDGEVVEVA